MFQTTRDENRAAGLAGRPPREYRARKLVEPPICARAGCTAGPADDSDLCPSHRDEKRRRNREYKARRYQERRRPTRGPKLCIDCGERSRSARCPACRILVGEAPKRLGVGVVDNTAQTRKHADGRTRFHGQMRRGRQTNASLDDQDMISEQKIMDKARRGRAYADSLEIQERGRIERESAELAWLGLVFLARRQLDEVLERHRYEERIEAAAPRERK